MERRQRIRGQRGMSEGCGERNGSNGEAGKRFHRDTSGGTASERTSDETRQRRLKNGNTLIGGAQRKRIGARSVQLRVHGPSATIRSALSSARPSSNSAI